MFWRMASIFRSEMRIQRKSVDVVFSDYLKLKARLDGVLRNGRDL